MIKNLPLSEKDREALAAAKLTTAMMMMALIRQCGTITHGINYKQVGRNRARNKMRRATRQAQRRSNG